MIPSSLQMLVYGKDIHNKEHFPYWNIIRVLLTSLYLIPPKIFDLFSNNIYHCARQIFSSFVTPYLSLHTFFVTNYIHFNIYIFDKIVWSARMINPETDEWVSSFNRFWILQIWEYLSYSNLPPESIQSLSSW